MIYIVEITAPERFEAADSTPIFEEFDGKKTLLPVPPLPPYIMLRPSLLQRKYRDAIAEHTHETMRPATNVLPVQIIYVCEFARKAATQNRLLRAA